MCPGLISMSGISTATDEAEGAGKGSTEAFGVPEIWELGLEGGNGLDLAGDGDSAKASASSGYIA